MFQAIDRAQIRDFDGFYHKIVEDIKASIVDGTLKTGMKLPSERDLAAQFGVSRVPVREALKTLEFMGIVQHIRGNGVYIRSVDIHDLLQHIEFAVQNDSDDIKQTLNELFEVREAIEVKAAQLAAAHRTEKDLQILRNAVFAMECDIKANRNHKQSSMDFHSGIIDAAQNKILSSINKTLLNLLWLSRQKSAEISGRGPIALEFHRKLFKAIQDKNTSSAGELMKEHLGQAKRALSCNKE
ncbi:FadR/GntR family transcriptional regulator [Pectinatus haikarae]|uniref:GntR family transcriptional repressor for pyruvate dehydrogenase complex n=1 Tax=Pectinatus haikarae TaxID=349096 RepID=A0ABT9Y9I1_9FIRM|nr:FadR/GntR family transcriptional regulator [Pectinatus haikarae]MDQ0204498.1 GntR family transcriptional repressor for pyruvate dehydrogenase complex [Pectinatus haikarae]